MLTGAECANTSWIQANGRLMQRTVSKADSSYYIHVCFLSLPHLLYVPEANIAGGVLDFS
ncbi:hypothetical protein BDW68DRAFT_159469 [Aspergillus falconensis]